jgi:hypothetical protein
LQVLETPLKRHDPTVLIEHRLKGNVHLGPDHLRRDLLAHIESHGGYGAVLRSQQSAHVLWLSGGSHLGQGHVPRYEHRLGVGAAEWLEFA